MNEKDIPLSFVMALAENENALEKFNAMTDSQKRNMIDKTKGISTKKDMRNFVTNSFNELSM